MEYNKDENQAGESGNSRRMRGRKAGRSPRAGCALKVQLRCTINGKWDEINWEKEGDEGREGKAGV